MIGRPLNEYLNIGVNVFDLRSDNAEDPTLADFSMDFPEIHPCTEEELANFYPRNKVAD